MRRSERQMEEQQAWALVDQCSYGVLSTVSPKGIPYGIPLNHVRKGKEIFFHCAVEGHKLDNLAFSPQVCFTCVGVHNVLEERFTTAYQSAVLFGRAEEVLDVSERIDALRLLCQRLTPTAMDQFENMAAATLGRLAIWRIVVAEITGKENK